MKKVLFILLLQNILAFTASCQAFKVDDLVAVAAIPSKNIEHFMSKNGFALYKRKIDGDTMEAVFIPKTRARKEPGPSHSVDVCLRMDSKYFTLHTSSVFEFTEGRKNLIKSGFFFGENKDTTAGAPMLFQKGNITVQAYKDMQDSAEPYTFKLMARAVPTSLMYAEELLQFDSHEFLTSFFGEQNVKKDMYYLSEKELKKCSVLFSGTRHQAVFVWGDENNLNNLSYILVCRNLPTTGAEKNKPLTGDNEWQFQSGIHQGMAIKDLLKINEMNFDIYGSKSDLAFMVKPAGNGKIDFKKTAVMVSCLDCDDTKMFDKQLVSALDLARRNLPVYVSDVIIYPSHPGIALRSP